MESRQDKVEQIYTNIETPTLGSIEVLNKSVTIENNDKQLHKKVKFSTTPTIIYIIPENYERSKTPPIKYVEGFSIEMLPKYQARF